MRIKPKHLYMVEITRRADALPDFPFQGLTLTVWADDEDKAEAEAMAAILNIAGRGQLDVLAVDLVPAQVA